MNRQRFNYSEEYRAAKRRSTFYGALAGIFGTPLMFLMMLIGFFNATCAGQSCDGSTAESCSPSTMPSLFAIIFVWLAVVIGFTIASIYFGVKAKEHEADQTNNDLEHRNQG